MNIQVDINLCRVCMKAEIGMKSLLVDALLTKFEFVTHLRVKKGDNLPTIICEKCFRLLNLCNKFIKSANATEQHLRAFLAKMNNDFKLVTKLSPGKSTISTSDNVDDMLALLESSDIEDDQNISLIYKEDYMNKSTERNFIFAQNEKESDKQTESHFIEELESIEEDVQLPAIMNTIESGQNRKQDYISKSVAQYSNLNEENNQLIDFESLDDILVSEEENAQISESEVKEVIQSDGYIEEYESMLEDDNGTMDVLYEENPIQVDLTKAENVVETILVKVDERNYNFSKEETTTTPSEAGDFEMVTGNDTKSSYRKLTKGSAMKKTSSSSVTENMRFYCGKCNRDFSTKTNLTRHLQSHEGKRPYQCSVCFKGFSQNGTLKQHMYIHTGEKPHVCTVCNRGFTQSKSLVFHMRRHTGLKPHQCDYCGTLFRQKDALKVHILKHHTDVNERAFSCKICNTEMKSQELRSHMKKHLNNHPLLENESNDIMQLIDETDLISERIFLDDELTLGLDGSTHVIDLIATSTKEPSRAKKYQCRKCFKCFAIKKNLVRHLSFHDVPVSALQPCASCNLVFDTNYALKVHRVRDHKEMGIDLNECEECDLKFQNAADLNEHIKYSHSFRCSVCPDALFATEKLLSIHLLEHNINDIESED